MIAKFLISEVLRKALNLKEVPDYGTIYKAVKELREDDLRKLLEKSAKLLGVKLEFLAIDSTGLRGIMPVFTMRREVERRTGESLPFTDSQMILSANISILTM